LPAGTTEGDLIMRAGTSLGIGGSLALLLSFTIAGCDKLMRNSPAEAGKVRAELKRQQQACASPSANDRLKNSIFDEAIAESSRNRANLDSLSDYSVARMENPVVKGWDSSLDITHCKGRFILEVPPGAERAFSGERQLRADIDYTAQASADGAGYVYEQKGAEPIVARLAAFNLGVVAFRPPPAIDEPTSATQMPEQASIAEAQTARQQSAPTKPSPPVIGRRAEPSAPRTTVSRQRVADRTPVQSSSPAPLRTGAGNGEATVRAFYNALGEGNGAAASSQVIPEKRASGAFSPGAIARFYGRLPEPVRLSGVVPLGGGTYRVTYHYSAGRSRCNGSAVVRLTDRGGRTLIRSIHSLSGC
jgi:hypothetical protein